MKIFAQILFFCFICIHVTDSSAQSSQQAINNGQEVNVLFRNEATGGIYAGSRGWGAFYRRGKHITAKTKRIFEINTNNLRHPKEIKVEKNQTNSIGRGFIYGKLNSVFMIKGGLGIQRVLYTKPQHKNVEIRFINIIGPNLTIAKPVYLSVYTDVPSTSGTTKQVVNAQYDPNIHNLDNISGRAPYFLGLNKSKIYPGLYAKLGFSFEYGTEQTSLKAIELGTIVDAYLRPLPIMANYKKEQVVVTLYAAFVFGKKWF